MLTSFGETIFKRTYAFNESETWEGCANRVATFLFPDNKKISKRLAKAIAERKIIPGGRYLYGCGREVPALTNCYLIHAKDSREGWADLVSKHIMALSTGGGVGTYYGDVRPKGSPLKRFGGIASGPVSLMAMVNEVARHIQAGGTRRSALLAGLPWNHQDIDEFIHAKDWSTFTRALKEKDFNHAAILDQTNISIALDDAFFKAIEAGDKRAFDVYHTAVKRMLRTSEPGFTVDIGKNAGQVLRNPCGEVTSNEDYDTCNLGHINLARVENLDELEELTVLQVEMLMRGTEVGIMPHQDFTDVRKRNRRIGAGFMGLHEWLLVHGHRYEPNDELGLWLDTWSKTVEETAKDVADRNGWAVPVATRAIAPTGTTSIIAGTTSGVEPIFCVAYKRRFLDNGRWHAKFVIDPTAHRLIQQGVKPFDVEDAMSLALDYERRISMQAFVQDYVDMAISSTINLPEYGEPGNNDWRKFAKTLLRYLPRLRGVTVYADGSRPGQPITPVDYEAASENDGRVFEENEERCATGVCGV